MIDFVLKILSEFETLPTASTTLCVPDSETLTRIIAQNILFNLRKIDNRIKWKNYVIVTRVKLSVELNVLNEKVRSLI